MSSRVSSPLRDRPRSQLTSALRYLETEILKAKETEQYFEVISLSEKALVIRHELYGGQSLRVSEACKELGRECNRLAVRCLHNEEFSLANNLLQRAELLSRSDPPGKAWTFNNYAGLFRRQGQLHSALRYMKQALAIEQGLPQKEVLYPADTYINMCAVLSQCGRHKDALKHANSALKILQTTLFKGDGPGGSCTHALRADQIATMVIAYHNIGVENEYIRKFTNAMKAYTRGAELADTYLGENHGLTLALRKSQYACRSAIDKVNKDRAEKEEAINRAAEEEMLKRSSLEKRRAKTMEEKKMEKERNPALDSFVQNNSTTFEDTSFGKQRKHKTKVPEYEDSKKELDRTTKGKTNSSQNSSASQLGVTGAAGAAAGSGSAGVSYEDSLRGLSDQLLNDLLQEDNRRIT